MNILTSFPEPEIKDEEVTSDKVNVLKVEHQMEASFEEYLHDDNLNGTLDDNQDILEDDTKATMMQDSLLLRTWFLLVPRSLLLMNLFHKS